MENYKIKSIIKNEKIIILILIILLCVSLYIYHYIINKRTLRENYTKEIVNIDEENEKTIFSIDKIMVYSSADAIDNTEEKNLQNLSVCQYTDIAIYINNKNSIKETTAENTINELYIDDINISLNSGTGNQLLNYKDIHKFGKYESIENSGGRINYNVLHTNIENETYDYSNPTFFTDCSNPITLGYVNKDIVTKYKVSKENNLIVFDGKVLKTAGVNLKDIGYSLSFTIHIRNNLDQEFVYNADINVSLEDESIYNGFTVKMKSKFDEKDKFFKIS